MKEKGKIDKYGVLMNLTRNTIHVSDNRPDIGTLLLHIRWIFVLLPKQIYKSLNYSNSYDIFISAKFIVPERIISKYSKLTYESRVFRVPVSASYYSLIETEITEID